MVEHKLSILTKICFALGGIPYTMCANSLAFFISPFLLETAGVNRIKLKYFDLKICYLSLGRFKYRLWYLHPMDGMP